MVEQRTSEQVNTTELRQLLIQLFDENELHTLSEDLGIDYESLPTIGKANKARALIAHAKRYARIGDLVEASRSLRPDADWQLLATEQPYTPFGQAVTEVEQPSSGEQVVIHQFMATDTWQRPYEDDPLRRWEAVVGCESQIEVIARRLDPRQRSSRLAIYGLAGMGKSTLAATYADQYGKIYPGGVLWANTKSDDAPTILNRWARQASRVDSWQALHSSNKFSFDAAMVRNKLDNHGPILVIFDDVHDLVEIEPLLAALPSEAHMLITTREFSVAQRFGRQPMAVAELSIDAAVTLLKQDLDNLDDALLQTVSKAVGSHPQTLRLVGAQIRRRSSRQLREADIEALLQRIQRDEVLGIQTDAVLPNQQRFEVALRFIYDEIAQDPATRALYQLQLRQLAVLASSEADFSTEMAAAVWNTTINEAATFLEELRDHSLVVVTTEGRWAQHTLVRSFMRALLVDEDERQQALSNYIVYTAGIVTNLDNMLENWERVAPDLTHIHVVGHLLVVSLEEILHYDPEQMTIEDVAHAALPPAIEDVQTFLQLTRMFMMSSMAYVLNYAQAEHLAHRWLCAATMVSRALNDSDSEALTMFYWYRRLQHLNQAADSLYALEHLRTLAVDTSDSLEAQVLALSELGEHYHLNGNIDEALDYFQQASAIVEQHPTISANLQMNLLCNIGDLHFGMSQTKQALEYFKQAYALLPPHESVQLRLRISQALSICYSEQGNHEEALQFFAHAAPYLDMPGAFSVKANLLNTKTYIHMSLGEMDAASEAAQQALELGTQRNEITIQVVALNNLALIQLSLGVLEQAQDLLEQAQSLLPYLTNKGVAARTIGNLGVVYYAHGRSSEALDLLRESLSALSDIKDTSFATRVLTVIGKIFQSTGQIDEGIEFFKQTLEVINKLNSEGGAITILNWISLLYQDNGDPYQALRYFERVIPALERITDVQQRGPALMLVGGTYITLGKYSEASLALQEALQIWQRLGDRANECEALLSLANCYILLRDFDAAEQALEQSQPLLESSTNLPTQALFSKTHGSLMTERKEFQQALTDYDHTIELCVQTNNVVMKIATINNIALVYMRMEDFPNARVKLREAIEEVRTMHQPELQSLILSNLSFLYFSDGEATRGIDSMKTAIDLLEQNNLTIDAGGQTVDLLRAYLEILSHIDIYDRQIRVAPLQTLAILVHSTSWNMAESLLNVDAMRDPALDDLLQQEITRATDDTTLAEVLRMYRDLLLWARKTSVAEACTRARNEFEKSFVYHWWGRVYLASCAYAAALVNLNRAIELNPNQGEYYIDRGWAYRGIGNYAAALRDFDQAVLRMPKADPAYLGRGATYFEMNNHALALTDLARAIEFNAKNAFSYQWRGTIYLDMGDTVAAADDLAQVIHLDPNFYDHYYWRALVRLSAGDHNGAFEDLTHVFESDTPDSFNIVVTMLWRGLARHLAGKHEFAQAFWKAADDTARKLLNRVQQHLALGLHAAMTGRLDRAYEHYEDVLKLRYTRHIVITQIHHLRLLERLLPQQPKLHDLVEWLIDQME